MQTRKFALISGIALVAIGILSLIPALNIYAYVPVLNLNTSYGYFIGLFPMNIVNKFAAVIFGAAGIAASQAPTTWLPRSIQYSRWVCVAFGALTVLGIIPYTSTLFGYMPLFGGEVLLHGAFAVLGGYFGFMIPRTRVTYGERNKQQSESLRRVA